MGCGQLSKVSIRSIKVDRHLPCSEHRASPGTPSCVLGAVVFLWVTEVPQGTKGDEMLGGGKGVVSKQELGGEE